MQPVPAAGCGRTSSGSRRFDDFVAQYAEVVARDSGVRLAGRRHRHARGRQPRAPRQDLGRRGVLVLGPPRAAQAAPRHPPRRPERRAARRRRQHARADPGAPAARRQHRHGGARHGQLRPGASAPGRAARRLAQREGAHRRLGRQLHHRRRRGLLRASRRRWPASTGCAPRPRASATWPSRC